MSRYTANIGGKEVIAEPFCEEHVSGFYRPRVRIGFRWMSFEQWPPLESQAAATEHAAAFLESLGFTKQEPPT